MNHSEPGTSQNSILVVDDNPENIKLLSSLLGRQGYEILTARNGQSAISTAVAQAPDLILLDISMPGMDGFEVCDMLKNEERTKDIPVIFVSASDEIMDKVKAFSIGGVDYIPKPFQIEEVISRIETHLTMRNLRKSLEEKNTQLEQEILLRKQSEAQLIVQARTDPLTNLFNRRTFFDFAEKELSRSFRYAFPMSILIFDIDHFKLVNDDHGHQVGDKVLIEVGKICKGSIRNVDLLARYGGEEFIILLPQTGLYQAKQVADRLCKNIADARLEFGGKTVSITVSLGIADMKVRENLSLDELIKRADTALYQAKEAGRNQVAVWQGS